MDDHELGRLLGDSVSAPAASFEGLSEIIERRQRRHYRTIGAMVVVALVGAVGTGFVVANRDRATDTRVATAAPAIEGEGGGDSSVPQPTPGMPLPSFDGLPKSTKLFVRTTADGVTIRAYEEHQLATDALVGVCEAEAAKLGAPPGLAQTCKFLVRAGPALRLGISTDAIVFSPTAPYSQTEPTPTIESTMFGHAGFLEEAPVTYVAARTGPSVVRVRARFADSGIDEMAPVAGWVAFARQGQLMTGGGSLEAIDQSGAVIATAPMKSANLPIARSSYGIGSSETVARGPTVTYTDPPPVSVLPVPEQPTTTTS